MRARINDGWMRHVTFHDPASTVIEPGVTIGVDVELGQGVSLRGTTRVGRGAHIDDGAVLIDTVVGAGARVRPYTVAAGAEIAAGAMVGPLASLGPSAKAAGAAVAANGKRNGAAARRFGSSERHENRPSRGRADEACSGEPHEDV